MDWRAWRELQMRAIPEGTATPGDAFEENAYRRSAGRVGAPIPVANEDGSISTERTITVGGPDSYQNVPSMWGGVQLPEREAMAAALQSGIQFPSYGSIPEAESAAILKSAEGGALSQPVDVQAALARLLMGLP